MSASMWWSNLLSYSLQVLALIVAGGLLAMIFRLRLPAARLACWQLLLIVCLLLPAVQDWKHPLGAVSMEILPGSSTPRVPVGPSSMRIPWGNLGLAVLGVGAALRALWLLGGLRRLRAYRRKARALQPLPDSVRVAQARLGVRAAVCISGEAAGPVTFGFRRPVILLPGTFLEMPPAVQEAIACHELLHVRRRDWIWSVSEECIGILLWFHPAIWWLLGQIRLSREQVVDREVVGLTGEPEQYVETLLTVARSRVQLDLAPAPLLLRKRHLLERVALLSKEISMSTRRLVASSISMAVVLLAAGWFVVQAFPLQGTPQSAAGKQPDTDGVAIQAGGVLLHREAVEYPRAAMERRIQGTVVLEVSVNEEGVVSDARVLSGPEELRRSALQSVLQWHYAKDAGLPSKMQVGIDFRLPERGAADRPVASNASLERARRLDEEMRAAAADKTVRGTLKQVNVDSLPQPLGEALRSQLAQFEGQPFSNELMGRIQNAVIAADRHVGLLWRKDPTEGCCFLTLSLGPPKTKLVDSALSEATAASAGPGRIRVGGNVQSKNLVEQTRPAYPPLAKQARIQGVVKLDALIGKDGHVRELGVISGHPLLVPAALEAVKQWVYRPTLLNGDPVEVITQIDVNFTLVE